MKTRILFVFFSIVMMFGVQAQDIKFSQYYSAPHLYNPALTGNFKGDLRASLIYRSQWIAPFNAYRTIGGGADFNIGRQKFKGSGFGVGINFYSDQAGDLDFNTNQVLLSAAYTQKLGWNMPNFLSAGFQATIANRSVNMSKAIYENQLGGGTGYDVVGMDNYWYFSLGLGMLWYAEPTDNINFYLGGSAYNLLKPNQSFFLNSKDALYVRYVGQAGINFAVNDRIDVNTSTMYQRQGPFQEYMVGVLGRYDFSTYSSQGMKLGVGLWYRMQDAIIPTVKAEYHDFVLTFSYDVNLSTLTRATRSNGGPEISLTYQGFWNSSRKKDSNKKNYFACPTL
ncbi:MAG: PorP/SprF family type IX secretion system membrane protein [Chitinophagales bacterium]|nr:PorP/SprF family type IX secretion system membrane protein [Chitinophagales bacterium]MCZ2394756.1 PorP/SprF family type IX secretion system membrane protein [Chitinophagales bacterium]